jgi:hypothetical protein
MDDKILLIIILISGIYFYNSIMKKRELEHMSTVTGAVYKVKTNDKEIEFNKVNLGKSIYFNMRLEHLKKLPIVDSDTINNIVNLDLDKKLWNGKKISLYKIIKIMQKELEECGSEIKINTTDLENIKDRKEFIKMIPYLKKEILEKINYETIRCFIKKREPTNLINIIKLNENIPALFDMNNSIIINNYLYKITYLGIIKYKLDIKLDIDDNANLLNASLESTLLNDINNHTNTNDLIIILKGEPYKLINNKVNHLLTNEVFQIDVPKNLMKNNFETINDESNNIEDELESIHDELESIYDESTEEEQIKEKTFNMKSLFYIDDKLKFIFNNKIYPNKGIGIDLNYFIKSNDLYIRSVNNFYYYKNNQLKFRILFICNSNLYFYVENNSISDLLYFDDYFKFKSTHNIDQDLVCAQYNSVLSQLKISKKINDDIKTNILKSLKCTF